MRDASIRRRKSASHAQIEIEVSGGGGILGDTGTISLKNKNTAPLISVYSSDNPTLVVLQYKKN